MTRAGGTLFLSMFHNVHPVTRSISPRMILESCALNAGLPIGFPAVITWAGVAAPLPLPPLPVCPHPGRLGNMVAGMLHPPEGTLMSLLIRYAHIPFYFRFSFTFPTSLIHHYAPPLRCDRMTIALALSDRSCLFDGHMTYDSHVFTSILSVSNVPPPAVRPRVLAPRGQALSIASPYARILVYHSYLTSLYLPFTKEHHR